MHDHDSAPGRHELALRKDLRLNLTLRGILLGAIVGVVIVIYRIAINRLGALLLLGLGAVGGKLLESLLLFAGLLAVGAIASALACWEPLSSGSGIPQINGLLSGRLRCDWRRILPAKFIGGILCLGSGLTLGREGPSVQIGGSLGQAYGDLFRRPLTERKYLISAGAAAGLAAAFNAPIAGVVFCLEELHRNFSPVALVTAMGAAFSSDFVTAYIFGIKPVLHFEHVPHLPLGQYPLLILLGILMGLSGVLFNKLIMSGKALYEKLPLHPFFKCMIPFVVSAIVALTCLPMLFSGEALIFLPTGQNWPAHILILSYIGKILLLLICFCSGLPGGIFLPLLVLGSLLGNACAQIAALLGLIEPEYILVVSLLAMAAHFAAIVRSPLTGVLLIAEMSGSFAFMLPLGVIALFSYITAELMRSEPVYEALLHNILRKRPLPTGSHVAARPDPQAPEQRAADIAPSSADSPKAGTDRGIGADDEPPAETVGHHRLLLEFAVEADSPADGARVRSLEWPVACLLVSIKRGNSEFIPDGASLIRAGDYLVVYLPVHAHAQAEEQIHKLCRSRLA